MHEETERLADMHEETERLAEVTAAARDARDWLAETIDRCRAGQPLDLEPLTLAHQRLEGLNLGDGEALWRARRRRQRRYGVERGVRRG